MAGGTSQFIHRVEQVTWMVFKQLICMFVALKLQCLAIVLLTASPMPTGRNPFVKLPMPAFIHSCALLTGLLLFEVVSCTSCYYPDGSLAESDSPCFPDANVSFCCETGIQCLTDKVCLYRHYIRGSCTDKSWSSPECPQFCLQSNFIPSSTA
jgi:hypothetical protein